jgi:hypothetical protein
MSRLSIPYAVADISALSRSLRGELERLGRIPSHLELLNMLARSAGHANYQHLRAGAQPAPSPIPPRKAAPEPDLRLVERAANHFGPDGQLLRWPARDKQVQLCLWVLWSRIPAGHAFSEAEIGGLLNDWHSFGDHALLRRALFDARLVDRTVDGREYRRIEQPPPPELRPLLALIAARLPAQRGEPHRAKAPT